MQARGAGDIDKYVSIDVSSWEEIRTEYVGVTAKYWLRPPGEIAESEEWLWKEATIEASGHFRVLGHDWSERVATEIARRLGVPSSTVELASRHGARGVISKTFAPRRDGLRLSNGSELLPNVVDGYPAQQKGEVPGYTLDAVFAVLEGYGPHPDAPEFVDDAASTFAGYLMFDALIGNGDRHHDNWGVIDGQGGVRYLAPAFDQATGLGYQELEDHKVQRLKVGSVHEWAEKGRSRQFEGRPALVGLAIEALSCIPRPAAEAWIERVASVEDRAWDPMLARVPDDLMSQVARTFAVEILKVNRRRLLDEWNNRTGG